MYVMYLCACVLCACLSSCHCAGLRVHVRAGYGLTYATTVNMVYACSPVHARVGAECVFVAVPPPHLCHVRPICTARQENVSSFLQAARSLGLAEFDCFCTPDLFEEKDVGAVREAHAHTVTEYTCRVHRYELLTLCCCCGSTIRVIAV